jgi:hypothetical protein
MMLQSNYCVEREAIIGKAVTNLASELRLVDIEYLISFITLHKFNHIADHVSSSAERYFTPGFITLGNGCDVSVGWEKAPEVTIDLIMHLSWAKVYFSLKLKADHAFVSLNYFAADNNGFEALENTLRLQRDIRDNMLTG